jgi:hypothetical protein
MALMELKCFCACSFQNPRPCSHLSINACTRTDYVKLCKWMHPCGRGWNGVCGRYSEWAVDYSTGKRRSILGTGKKSFSTSRQADRYWDPPWVLLNVYRVLLLGRRGCNAAEAWSWPLSSLTRKVPNTHPPEAAQTYSELWCYGSAALTLGGVERHCWTGGNIKKYSV